MPVVILSEERDQAMIDFMVNLWTNFAKHHNPTPINQTWLPCQEKEQNCYVILDDSKIIAQTDENRQRRIDFWKNISK